MWKRFGTHLMMLPLNEKMAEQAKPLYKDMYKLGVEHFSVSLLERFTYSSEEEARKREQEWIDKLGASAPHGYNLNRAYKPKSFFESFGKRTTFIKPIEQPVQVYHEKCTIRCVETGKTFYTAGQAGRAYGADDYYCDGKSMRATIYNSCREGTPVKCAPLTTNSKDKYCLLHFERIK